MSRNPSWANTLESRIEMTDPEQLLAHPANARRHPGKQRDALRASLDKAGWVSPVIVNRKTGRVLDGHARVEEAITKGVQVPVAYVTVTENKESYILATFDAVGSMAEFDQQALTDLLLEIETTGADELDKTLAYIADLELGEQFEPPAKEPNFYDTPPPAAYSPEMNEPLVTAPKGSGGAVKSIILTYPADRYDSIMEQLNEVEGETNADKLANLLGVD